MEPDSPELFALYVDLLYFRCAQFLIDQASPGGATTYFPAALDTTPFSCTALPFSVQRQQRQHSPQSFPPSPMLMPASVPLPTAAAHSTQDTRIPTAATTTTPPPTSSILHSILHLALRLSSSPITHTILLSPGGHPAPLLTDIQARLLGPLYLVATHAADEAVRASAMGGADDADDDRGGSGIPEGRGGGGDGG
ncbi:hypothetical protein VTK26DRAFT_8064 [Humicola hyalothermophila]